MTIDPAVFRALVAQGATPEMLLAVVEADAAAREEKLAKKRADTAARVRKHRSAKKVDGVTRNDGNALHGVTERYSEDAPPPNDIYSNPPPEPLGAKAPNPPFSEKVVEAWNDGPAKRGATKARKLDASRKKLLASRVREHGEDGVLLAIRGIEISDFHCGIGPNSFVSNLGWLLKNPEKFVAAIERAEAKKPTAGATVMNGEQSAAYLASIAEKPWMRGRENELQPEQRASGPPRSFAQLAGGIAGSVMVQ